MGAHGGTVVATESDDWGRFQGDLGNSGRLTVQKGRTGRKFDPVEAGGTSKSLHWSEI
jgi:hypothetical protein